jgi:hypothetical protein
LSVDGSGLELFVLERRLNRDMILQIHIFSFASNARLASKRIFRERLPRSC